MGIFITFLEWYTTLTGNGIISFIPDFWGFLVGYL